MATQLGGWLRKRYVKDLRFLSPSFEVRVCVCVCANVWECVCTCMCVCTRVRARRHEHAFNDAEFMGRAPTSLQAQVCSAANTSFQSLQLSSS